MTKKHFVALANAIIEHNRRFSEYGGTFNDDQLATLARFCMQVNSNFKTERWLDYIAGKCGPNGGSVKQIEYEVQGNYGQGWETVCTEDNRKVAMERLREYRENEPQYQHKLVRKAVSL